MRASPHTSLLSVAATVAVIGTCVYGVMRIRRAVDDTRRQRGRIWKDESEKFLLRPLKRSDLGQELLALLSELTVVGTPSSATLNRQYDVMTARGSLQSVYVLEDIENGRLVGSGCLLKEPKFIHCCSSVGHIEDVVVARSHRGKRLGRFMIQNLVDEARDAGCYKVILDCDEKNVPFYEKCGLSCKGQEMAVYF
jgi:glucosamine-phosphate N-acetyltransferase